MKNTIKSAVLSFLAVIVILCAVSCGDKVDPTGLWESASYRSDTTLGDGANTLTVELSAQEQTILFTIKTDKATLGDALFEHGLINDPTFFNVCNGLTADWDKDQAYWAFYVDGEMAQYGVGDPQAVTADAPEYKIVYTK